MTRHLILATLVAFFPWMTSHVQAQGSWDSVKALPSGTTVRIHVAGKAYTGDVDTVDDRQIVVQSGDRSVPIERQLIRRVDKRVSVGNAKRRTLVGAAIGATAGAAAAALARAIDHGLSGRQVAGSAVGYGIIGALIGRARGHSDEYLVIYATP